MGRIDVEMVEETDGIGCHFDHRIGHPFHRFLGEERSNHAGLIRRLPGSLRRQPAVAIVEPNDLKALGDKQLDEVISPVGQLAPQAHNKQQWFAVATEVVFDRDSVDVSLGHRRTVTADLRGWHFVPSPLSFLGNDWACWSCHLRVVEPRLGR